MITSNMTIAQIVNDHPTTVDVFTAKGLKGLDHDLILQKIGGFSLQSILEKKGMDVDSFVTLLNEAIAIQQKDITLYNDLEKHAPIKVVGLLPCPVRIPLMEKLDALEQSQHISFELKAASEGLDWLSERVRSAQSEDDLADMYISAGFDLFFDQGLMKKFKDQKTFADLTQIDFHSDFQNETIALQDPNKDYAMIAVVAAVFLINKKVLGDRPAPQTWSDLFDPIYENSLSLPVSDFDLFNAILLHLYQEFGLEGI
ncbi:MAG: ABC transporter substrate-binding protein, partial [Erysipelotrichaceae bacterium]